MLFKEFIDIRILLRHGNDGADDVALAIWGHVRTAADADPGQCSPFLDRRCSCVVTFIHLENSAMPSTNMTSREFNQDTGRAKKAAKSGPVFITDRGKPAHVLLSIEDYRKLTGVLPAGQRSLADALAQPEDDADFEFTPPTLNLVSPPADLE